MKLAKIMERDENSDVNKAPAVGNTGDYLTVKQFAHETGLSPSRIRQLIGSGDLVSKSPTVGQRDNLIHKGQLTKYKKEKAEGEHIRTGRPSEGKGFGKKDVKEGFDSLKSIVSEYKQLKAQGKSAEAKTTFAELVRLAGSKSEAEKLIKATPITDN